jgi:hypothetical protein
LNFGQAEQNSFVDDQKRHFDSNERVEVDRISIKPKPHEFVIRFIFIYI